MDLKQIISLHLDGLSNRKISATLGIARNTVNGYMQAFKASDHTLKELSACDNAVLESLFTSHTTIDNRRFDQLSRYFERMNKARVDILEHADPPKAQLIGNCRSGGC
jgi:hypothetical protein